MLSRRNEAMAYIIEVSSTSLTSKWSFWTVDLDE